MPLGDYLAGLGWFAVTLATVAAATLLVARRRLAGLAGEVRALALFLVAVAVLFLIHLVPLLLGALAPGTPPLAGGILCLALWRFLPAAPAAALGGPPADRPPGVRAARVVAAVAVATAAVALLAYTAAVALVPFTQVDVVNFHLPGVARWIQSGSLWQVDQFLAYQAQGNYPNTGDVVHLAAVLPWREEFAVRYVALPFVAATGVGVFALARELRAPTATAATFGALAVTIPTVAASNVDFELTDAIMYATFVAGALFLARHVRTRAGVDLALAGVGLGLSFGVKWYAVSSVAIVVAVWAAGLLAARRPVLADAGRLVALIAGLGGVWLLRNWVESGNPLFPVNVRVLGVTVFHAPYDLYRHLAGFSLLDYADRPSILRRYAWPDFNRTLGFAWLLSVAGCVAALGTMVARRRLDRRVAGAVVCALLLAIAYAATPYSALGGRDLPVQIGANTRYAIPALLLAACVTAWTAGRLGRLGLVVDVLGLAGVADGLRRDFDPVAAKHWLAGALVAAAGAAAVLAWRRLGERAPVVVGAAAALLAGLAAGGYAAQRRFVAHRYRALEPPLAWTGNARHRRVALAGLWDVNGLSPVYPAFGPRLHNRVDYVGPFHDGMLMQYLRPGPFVAALRRGRYDLLVVGRAQDPVPTGAESWARLAGYREVAVSPRLALFQRG